ncbi:MAG: hypothetical protein GDA36_01185 [Rhodobacteraceae bacterium]|nr:hypothetical protein [Paracoccaceae bacterium]
MNVALGRAYRGDGLGGRREVDPTGKHGFDKLRTASDPGHRLTPPTNGRVERFSGHIGEPPQSHHS